MKKIPTGLLSEELENQLGGGWEPGSLAVLSAPRYALVSARKAGAGAAGVLNERGYLVGRITPGLDKSFSTGNLTVYGDFEEILKDNNDIVIIDAKPGQAAEILELRRKIKQEFPDTVMVVVCEETDSYDGADYILSWRANGEFVPIKFPPLDAATGPIAPGPLHSIEARFRELHSRWVIGPKTAD